MRETKEGLDRVRQIVQDLKDFSQVDQAEWQWMDLHRGIDSTLNIVHSEIMRNAEVVAIRRDTAGGNVWRRSSIRCS